MTATAACEYFPGTSEPVPKLLTPLEACAFLRLDLGRDTEAAMLKALGRLVERKLLHATLHVGRRFYSRDELIHYVARMTEEWADAR